MIRLVLFLSIMLLSTIMPDAARAQQQLHIAILGDSNTWLGGDECDNQKGWNKWFKDILQPASCRSYARSGATWTHTTKTKRDTKENIGKLGKDNVIFNQVMRLKEAYDRGEQHKPDLILIAAGTNDAWFKKERPYAFNKDADDVFAESSKDFRKNDIDEILTLAEAVRYNCEWLSHFFPEAQIILLSPLQTTAAPTELIHQAGDIIEECGRRMSINTIRQDYGSCVNAMHEKEAYRYTYDGTHTSVEGAKRNGYYIARQVKSMLYY